MHQLRSGLWDKCKHFQEKKNKWALSLRPKNPIESSDLGWILKIVVFIEKKYEKESFMIKKCLIFKALWKDVDF